jgi:hypothetical protein
MSENEFGIDVSALDFPEVMDLRTAAIYLEVNEMRVRTLARDEELPSFKNEAGHWRFNLEDLQEFKAEMGTKKGGYRRGDRKYWRIQVKHEDLEAVTEALSAFEIEVEPMYQYEKKDAEGEAEVEEEDEKKGIFG